MSCTQRKQREAFQGTHPSKTSPSSNVIRKGSKMPLNNTPLVSLITFEIKAFLLVDVIFLGAGSISRIHSENNVCSTRDIQKMILTTPDPR